VATCVGFRNYKPFCLFIMWFVLTFTLSISTPPASRLVGVELNPGPTRSAVAAAQWRRVDHPTEADVQRIWNSMPAKIRTKYAYLHRYNSSAADLTFLGELWHMYKSPGRARDSRLPYGPASNPAQKLVTQQKHIMLWLSFLHHHIKCYTCQKPLDRTLIGEGNDFAEWHHVIDPPDYTVATTIGTRTRKRILNDSSARS
jgi:hypothetical protein